MINIDARSTGRVEASCQISIPESAHKVWGQMRDFAHFVTIDAFHERVVPVAWPLKVSDPFDLIHALGPLRIVRRCRLLKWSEGQGFAFSDLSSRGYRKGFPHVCSYQLRSRGIDRCELIFTARGKWTSTWLPLFARWVWLFGVLWITKKRLSTYFKVLSQLQESPNNSALTASSRHRDRTP